MISRGAYFDEGSVACSEYMMCDRDHMARRRLVSADVLRRARDPAAVVVRRSAPESTCNAYCTARLSAKQEGWMIGTSSWRATISAPALRSRGNHRLRAHETTLNPNTVLCGTASTVSCSSSVATETVHDAIYLGRRQMWQASNKPSRAPQARCFLPVAGPSRATQLWRNTSLPVGP